MSAPTPAPGDDRPREGYYPDPSIPGYVRYWNGASWVPGTSRPAPSDGRPLTPPSGGPVPAVEETGPHFFDEDPAPAAPRTGRSEPASAWGADRAHQSGFGGEQDRRVSWGAPQGADPRTPSPASPAPPEGRSTSTDGMATIPPAEPDDAAGAGDVVSGGTFVFRRPTPGPGAAPSGAPGFVPDEGTVTFRAPAPRTGGQDAAPAPGAQGPASAPASPAAASSFPEQAAAQTPGRVPSAAGGAAPAQPGFGAGKAAADRVAAAPASPQAGPAQTGPAPASAPAPAQGPAAPAAPAVPQQPAAGVPRQPVTPVAPAGPGGGQPSWAQQVHRLAGAEEGPVAPWKPPVDDIFQAAARRQASARPAGIGKRLAARLVDTVVLAAVTGAAAVPLGVRALDHVDEKIDAARLSGETVTVWLIDGTTSVYLGIVLAVLLVFGLVYEALPTAKWGRTLGKRLLGLDVRDIEGGEPPTYGAAVRRWLVYSVPGLLAVGVVGVVWGLFDKPWRQCWHDKAAHTFVAG
ncbi:RDD family protein [Streptomyces sp. NPDC048481]|uniref:RDD family protein n=1 Tax=Streptomyces sp. NPDC048481 TaxID=3365557 RepID=UPI00371289DB